jgi:hypothetical protein
VPGIDVNASVSGGMFGVRTGRHHVPHPAILALCCDTSSANTSRSGSLAAAEGGAAATTTTSESSPAPAPAAAAAGGRGWMFRYLQLARVAVILGDTLFVHGAVHDYNMGWVCS